LDYVLEKGGRSLRAYFYNNLFCFSNYFTLFGFNFLVGENITGNQPDKTARRVM